MPSGTHLTAAQVAARHDRRGKNAIVPGGTAAWKPGLPAY